MKKISLEKSADILFQIMILLSGIIVIQYIKNDFAVNRILNSVILLILVFFIFIRLYIHKKTALTFDEKIVLLFAASAMVPAFLQNNYHKMNFIVPISFGIAYLGISSYIKIKQIDMNFIINLLNIFIIYSVIHLLFAFLGSLDVFKGFPEFNFWINTFSRDRFYVTGLYDNPNNFANCMLMGVTCSFTLYIYCIKAGRWKYSIPYFFILLFCMYGIIMSSARGSFLGCVAYLSVTLAYLKIKNIRIFKLKSLFYILPVILVMFAILYKLDYITRFMTKFNNVSSGRFEHWSLFVKDLFVSFSPDIFFFGKSFKCVINPAWVGTFFEYQLHSIIFTTWAKYGLIGLTLIIILFYHLLKTNYKVIEYRLIFMIPLGFFIQNLFEDKLLNSSLWLESIFFTIIILIPCNALKNPESLKMINFFPESQLQDEKK